MEVECGFHLPMLSFIGQVCSVHLAHHDLLISHTLHECEMVDEKKFNLHKCDVVGGKKWIGGSSLVACLFGKVNDLEKSFPLLYLCGFLFKMDMSSLDGGFSTVKIIV